MINIYDFIRENSSYFDQLPFGTRGEIFIDYWCPLKENRTAVWSHMNCLMYVTDGSKGYGSGDYYHESREGQVLFARKGGYVLHQRFEKPYHAMIFMFDDFSAREFLSEYPELLPHTQSASPERDPTVVVELASSPFVTSIFTTSFDYLKHPTAESHISLQLKFKELLTNLVRKRDANPFHEYLAQVCNKERVSFVRLMRQNSHYNFTVEELSRIAGMSLSSFKRVFKDSFGIPPGKWLDDQRTSRAMLLLSDRDKTVSEIAFELGYNAASAFTKAFKRMTGKTPADYRKSTR